ncbi:TPA: hypothetical protein ACMDVK_004472 [Vibrio parahaemolyticus]|uniref:hypothetical protein n=1 Tax=Vibrio harveyi group TaxID=717610 RepID=UPI0004A33F22|nr:hypothetical protein [Vibrio parahaemolyticus]EGR2205840.1 hypothetical protein [Vibrio parahaemolyticus]MCC3818011.1 hypothetical protein [Vibrio parahaemolyticus]MCC3854675.1 hypothetical protein [Vibrio parahaemolyticus]
MSEITLKFLDIEVSIKDENISSNECIDKAVNTLLDLSVQLQKNKGETGKMCKYGDQEFSPGSVIEMPGGEGGKKQTKSCNKDGSWS